MSIRAWCVIVAAACGASTAPEPIKPTTGLPENHATPPPMPPHMSALLAWPVAPFNALQTAEVLGCKAFELGSARYPKDTAVDALASAYAVANTCDEATLAGTCADRVAEGAEPPASCLDAYRTAVRANPAFAVSAALVGGYFGKVALVAPPPIASHAITSVDIDYAWGGEGQSVEWHLRAHDLATSPKVTAAGQSAKSVQHDGDVAKRAGALNTALGNFVPIRGPMKAIRCFDNYPEWTVTLAFDTGEHLQLETHGSNLLGVGGPWQFAIGGVTYMQLGPDLAKAIRELVEASGQPFGEPMAMACHGYDLQGAVLGRP